MNPTPEPELVTIDPATTAVVREVVRLPELREFFDASFRALGRTLAAQGATVTGPAFGRYRGTPGAPGEALDVEVGFTTDRAVRSDGAVRAGELPGGKVARLVHAGAYDGLGASWERLRCWIGDQGLSAAEDRWEVYLTQPSPRLDPRTLRTELDWPLAG
ncbi:MAG TPA: GyrI-like domain-containing protein [Actinospica sp.]|jgi:effector-binding domain-containing protein|nr:GyrI-like domain-containing protein [Actinospica sp.]